jgi:RND superfamily putative drug exporter
MIGFAAIGFSQFKLYQSASAVAVGVAVLLIALLGGTFAAMIPSGMLSLIQIASIILTGLLLYTLIVLPIFVPVMVKTFGAANWWPFKRV